MSNCLKNNPAKLCNILILNDRALGFTSLCLSPQQQEQEQQEE